MKTKVFECNNCLCRCGRHASWHLSIECDNAVCSVCLDEAEGGNDRVADFAEAGEWPYFDVEADGESVDIQ